MIAMLAETITRPEEIADLARQIAARLERKPAEPVKSTRPDGGIDADGFFAQLEAEKPAEPVNGEELLAAREALIDMGYLWDGDQWVDVDPPSKTAEQDPEWPDFARMEASLQRLKERLVFENGRRKELREI